MKKIKKPKVFYVKYWLIMGDFIKDKDTLLHTVGYATAGLILIN